MSTDPNELRKKFAADLSAAMEAAQPTADEVARRSRKNSRVQGIWPQELAYRLAVSVYTVYDWLNGATEISRIARGNRIKVSEFMGIEEDAFVGRYIAGTVSSGQPAPAVPPVEAGRLEELAAQVGELQQTVKHLQDLLEARG